MTQKPQIVQLSNGLRVLLREIHTAPLVSSWVWYRVGSRDEAPGYTGISHWVEHMQFRGTPRFPGGYLDKAISRLGGYWNAMTSMDWTTYFLTMPSAHADLALELEADRMANSLFKPEDVEAERSVIISERQGNENSPFFKLGEELQAAAFRVHSYHHDVIGDMADLEAIQRDELYRHYRRYYVPNNAVLAIAGDFNTTEMLKKVEQFFGGLAPGEPITRRIRKEPPQGGERRVWVEGPGETAFAELGYHIPGATHPDFIPLIALSSLLAGPLNMNMFGDGGISNKTSRIYKALVETELAVSASGGLQTTIDPYLYTLTVITHPEKNTATALKALEVEIEKIQEHAPNPAELQRAVKQARAMFAYGTESITNQAYWLGYTEMFDSVTWFETYLERLAAVTPGDVQRVAQTYLRPQNRTLGEYLPNGEAEGEMEVELDEE